MLRVIIDGPRDPQYNMAIDEAIMRMRREVNYNTLRIYMWSPSGVSLGRAQNAEKTVNIEVIKDLGFKLVRRPTGGSALLHPEDYELTYSVVLSSDHPIGKMSIEESSSEIAKGILNAIKILGIEANIKGTGNRDKSISLCYLRSGSSDIVIEGRKVSGSAQVRDNTALLQHGTLLLQFDPNLWMKVIKVSNVTPENLRNRIAGLYEYSNASLSQLTNSLVKGFSEALHEEIIIYNSLTPAEIELAVKLYKTKYSNDKWNINGEYQVDGV